MPRSHSSTGLLLGHGQRVGLLGGSFDPAHAGHLHISRVAIRRFGLDRVVWLMSPGNPLKAESPAALERRAAAARALVQDPRIALSDAEARLGTRHTAETLARLRAVHPGTRFVWLMGADNLAGFHHWDRWRRILELMPVGVLARPGYRLPALTAPAARIFAAARLPERAAAALPLSDPPAWCFLNLPMVPDSSTALRRAGAWKREGG